MGYKLAGCEVIGNCEIDKKMNEVYVANHNPKFNFCMDIRDFNQIPDEELPEELFNLDILDGSPPCTTFSMAGQREESWGKKKKFREGQAEQTLDDLSFVFIDTVRKLKPKCVIMENVEGLLLGEAWTYVQQIYKELMDAGYQLKHYLCKGEQMGVPQKRHRVFFIAFRNDIPFDFDDLDMFFDYEPVTYGEIKDGEPRLINPNSETYKLVQQSLPREKNIADVNMRLHNKNSGFQSIFVTYNDVLPTQRASTSDCICREDMEYINKETFRNSQTFPQDYNFINFTNANISYICGMSVPPVMIKRIVNRIIDTGVFDKCV